jgi:hypothetical protein
MNITADEEMAEVIRFAISGLDPMESAFVKHYYLGEPRGTLAAFALKWQVSPKDLAELRVQSLEKLKERLVLKGITSIRDIL